MSVKGGFMAGRILVLGGSGNVGREITRRLFAEGFDFKAVYNTRADFPVEIKTCQLDLAHKPLLDEALKNVQTLILLLPMTAMRERFARNILAAAEKAGVRFILRISTLGADESSPYFLMRQEGIIDQQVIDSGIDYAILRPNFFMQNFVNFFGKALHMGALFLPQGEARTSFIDLRDVADAAVKILENPRAHSEKIYDLTGERALSNAEVISIMSLAAERRLAYVPVTDEAAIHSMTIQGWDPWTIEAVMSLHQAAKEGQTEKVSDHFSELTGQTARNIEKFCRELRSYWFDDSAGRNRTTDAQL
jgi:uncharacterized protein YbjT (DUF2867 family)